MASYNTNQCIFTGHLVADPVVTTGTKGDREWTRCEFALGVNHGKDGAGEEIPPSFFDFVVWGITAKNCGEYLAKGRKVLVVCKAKQEKWEKDGEKRSRVRFTADTVEFLGNNGNGNGNGGPSAAEQAAAGGELPTSDSEGDDGIPF